MKHKLERIDKKYFMKSILRLMLEDQTAPARNDDGLVSRKEILKDKLLIELIENPKKLWKHLSIKVRNLWISRVILSKRFKKKLSSNEELLSLEGDLFRDKIIDILSKLHFKSGYWEILKSFLTSEIQACKNWASLCRSLKSLEKNAFKTYFYSNYAVKEVTNSAQKSSNKNNSNGKTRIKMRSLDDF